MDRRRNSCSPSGPVDVPLATLAAEQEAYDGRTVVTEGVVVEVQDTMEAEPYYVLQDESDNRVRLLPTADARPHENQRVTVTGDFRFVPERGRELHVEGAGTACPERGSGSRVHVPSSQDRSSRREPTYSVAACHRAPVRFQRRPQSAQQAAAGWSPGVQMQARIGVEPFDVGYGASFAAVADSVLAQECPVVEDGGTLTPHDSPPVDAPTGRLAFVDGTMRTDARLTRSEADGTVTPGLAGIWAAGAALVEDGGIRIDRVRTGRVAVFCGGVSTTLPDQPGGWSWTSVAVEGVDLELARQRLQRLMRTAEGEIAEDLCDEGWLTVVDGPLNNVRRVRTTPIIGYVKTHHRPMLDADNWARVPTLAVGQRSSLFAMGEELYGAYLRVGDPGPWSSPWAGIVRLEVPAGAGRDTAAQAVDGAAAWLPRYASLAHRDPRAPVNLAPIAGLEQLLRRSNGNGALALRAVRAAVLQLNATAAPA